MKLSLLFITLFSLSVSHACDEHGKTGFLPENDLSIPVNSLLNTGITEDQFNESIDRAIEVYGPIFEKQGAEIKVLRLWDNDTVNAYATRKGNEWVIGMYGGLARHEAVTQDGFTLVVCHEIGHHIAGAPRKGAWWASSEGQSDYWGSSKCFRKYAEPDDNIEIVSKMSNVPTLVKETCADQFADAEEAAICVRGSMAGLSLGTLLNSLRDNDVPVKFDTPSNDVVTKTEIGHPKPQCRLDTYYQGALCEVDASVDTDQNDPNIGTCNRMQNYQVGLRSLCWFKPDLVDDSDEIVQLPGIEDIHY